MEGSAIVVVGGAALLGLVHTLIGPDHYLPFIMMSRARRWPLAKTLTVTVLCGVGHVLSSVVLGMVGVAAVFFLVHLPGIEGIRGQIAAWALIAFGIVYALWGLWRLRTGRTHTHGHAHGPEGEHVHEHAHVDEHSHAHAAEGKKTITPWVLFVIFVLGPCEPLIPFFMYPAARQKFALLLTVTLVFSVVTVATMTAVVFAGATGLGRLRLGFAERYVHVIAGVIIAASGLTIQLFDL